MKNAMTALAAVAAAALVCGAMAVCHVRAVAAEPAGPPAAEQVQALAAKLSDSDFRVREAAYKDLVKAGPAALPALEQAERSDDTEVQQRAAAAMKEIRAAVAAALSAELPKNYLWSYPMEHGAFAGPVLAGATLCAPGRDAKLHAIDAKTGKELWIAEMPGKAMLSGLLQMSANENVVAIVENLTVLAVFDVKKGDRNSVKLDLSLPAGAVEDIAEGMMMTSAYSAALRWSAIGGALYVGSSKGLFAFDGKTGQRLWGLPKRNLPSGEPLAVGDVLYFGTASFAASPLDDKLSPKDQPGLHALRLAGAAPAAAPAERH